MSWKTRINDAPKQEPTLTELQGEFLQTFGMRYHDDFKLAVAKCEMSKREVYTAAGLLLREMICHKAGFVKNDAPLKQAKKNLRNELIASSAGKNADVDRKLHDFMAVFTFSDLKEQCDYFYDSAAREWIDSHARAIRQITASRHYIIHDPNPKAEPLSHLIHCIVRYALEGKPIHAVFNILPEDLARARHLAKNIVSGTSLDSFEAALYGAVRETQTVISLDPAISPQVAER